MLSADIRQESMVKRIENIVSILMEERSFIQRGSKLFTNRGTIS
jgi:hypothetical protein